MASDTGNVSSWERGASRARGWVQRHPAAADLLVPLVLAGVTLGPAAAGRDASTPWWWLVAAVCLIPLIWRRGHPVEVFAQVTAAAVGVVILGFRPLGLVAAGALLAGLYTVAAHEPRRHALIAAGVFEGWAVSVLILWSPPGTAFLSIVLMTGTAAAAVMTGVNLQTRRAYLAALEDRAARLESEQDQQARLAVASERAHIAREVHDIVTHSLSVMVALADGAEAAVGMSPERAGEAMHQVAATGRQAIGEMRRLVGTLRIDEKTAADRHPAPGIDQLDELLSQVRAAGLAARLVVGGEMRQLAPGAQLAVYRIVQESLTNIRKHALAATGATVRLYFGADGVDVEVTDDGRPAGNLPDPAGHGIVGMRERAAAYGGTVDAGPGVRGGWRVHVRLSDVVSEEPAAR